MTVIRRRTKFAHNFIEFFDGFVASPNGVGASSSWRRSMDEDYARINEQQREVLYSLTFGERGQFGSISAASFTPPHLP